MHLLRNLADLLSFPLRYQENPRCLLHICLLLSLQVFQHQCQVLCQLRYHQVNLHVNPQVSRLLIHLCSRNVYPRVSRLSNRLHYHLYGRLHSRLLSRLLSRRVNRHVNPPVIQHSHQVIQLLNLQVAHCQVSQQQSRHHNPL